MKGRKKTFMIFPAHADFYFLNKYYSSKKISHCHFLHVTCDDISGISIAFPSAMHMRASIQAHSGA